ncbi:serine/threonine protein kinase [candidate division WS5 bacterium]|uniref:Serine/threonine protein kinase n=1 Tax=candidate division WS5 bacterium TaxID=2093353 RepID=A0A419DGC0_9BACT|nr:MAG: serine/threonine protein kinase [candidate division WS5 bacterium]
MAVPLYLEHKKKEVLRIEDYITSNEGVVYEVSDRIRSGGNAVVHRCVDAGNGNEYAIKFNLSFHPNRIERFQQEIEIVKQLNHEQIIKYIDSGLVTGVSTRRGVANKDILFLVMPLAETNLSEFIKINRGRIPHAAYIGQFKGLCEALSELHGIAIHRDIKPENVLLIGETWLISDLGLCKIVPGIDDGITFHGEPIGPKYWMSPEALNNALGNPDEINIKSDIYQLASIFWYVVTGRYPQGIVTKNDWTGPDYLFEPIYKSLHHDPSIRLNDAQELLKALEEA